MDGQGSSCKLGSEGGDGHLCQSPLGHDRAYLLSLIHYSSFCLFEVKIRSSGVKSQFNSGVKSEIETEVETEVKSEVESQVDAEIETEIETEVETEVESEVESGVKSGFESEFDR